MPEKSNGSSFKWIAVAIILVVVVAGIWLYVRHKRAEPVSFKTATAGRSELMQLVTATGTLNPVVNVTVGSQVSGRISRLYVDFNSIVTSNQVIAEIDSSTYQATVAQATADLGNAKANLELQQVEFKRSGDLFTNKLVSGSDFDTALASLHEAEAMVKIKQASLSNAMVNLNYCKILSPVDGVVISRSVDLGQTVASSFNTPTLFQIANDLTKMQIDSNVAEADVGGVIQGQAVDFTVDAYPNRTFHGEVRQVRNAPTTVNNVVTYDAVIEVTNADYKLKPGMTANVSIIVAQRADALNVPNAALRFRPPENVTILTNTVAEAAPAPAPAAASANPAPGGQGGKGKGRGGRGARVVYVLSGDESSPVLKRVQVKTGITDGIFTEITDGLSEGDRVVTGSTGGETSAAAPGASPFGGGGGGFGRGGR